MRRMIGTAGCGLIVALATVTVAQEPGKTTDRFGMEFGQLVGSEAGCGLSFKPEAVERVIRENVAAGDLEFNYTFGAYVSMEADDVREMSSTEKIVHCTTTERNARALGLID